MSFQQINVDRLTEYINKCMSSHRAHTKARTTATAAVYNFKLVLKFRFRFVCRANIHKWYMYRPICPLFSFTTPLTSLRCSFAPKGKYITLTNSHLYLSQIFTHTHTQKLQRFMKKPQTKKTLQWKRNPLRKNSKTHFILASVRPKLPAIPPTEKPHKLC